MKKIVLPITPKLVQLLALGDTAGEAELTTAIENLADLAQEAAPLKLKNSLLTTEKEKAVQDLADYKAAATKKEVRNLLDAAMAEHRLAKGLADNLEKDYAGKPEALKQILNGMPPYQSITKILADKTNTQLNNLMDKSWDELDRGGELPRLKDLSFDSFKEKFQQKFGKEYAGV